MSEKYYMNNHINEPGLYILCGRSGMGKTTLAINILSQKLKDKETDSALYFHSDPLSEDLLNRFKDSGIDFININDVAGRSVEGILYQARWTKEDKNLSMIVIDDFYDLLRYESFKHIEPKRKERIAYLLICFKCLADLFDIPVILIADADEYIDSKKDKHPGLSDMRDKKLIKEFADRLMFMYADAYYEADTELKNITEIRIIDLKKNTEHNHRLAYIGNSTYHEPDGE